ncbi:MAG: hypothetical protein N3H31_06265 [Candidatus Nezhaarchaeota archaeon]|nr:hypothetical protein [Candidatus Nezhaarchaeota archaeon]
MANSSITRGSRFYRSIAALGAEGILARGLRGSRSLSYVGDITTNVGEAVLACLKEVLGEYT